MFFTMDIRPLIPRPVRPRFNPMTMLLILLPIPRVHGPIHMCIYPLAMGLTVYPLTLVDITVYMYHSPVYVGIVMLPKALVHATIWPNLFPAAISHLATLVPLADVNRPVAQLHWFPVDNLYGRAGPEDGVVVEGTDAVQSSYGVRVHIVRNLVVF